MCRPKGGFFYWIPACAGMTGFHFRRDDMFCYLSFVTGRLYFDKNQFFMSLRTK